MKKNIFKHIFSVVAVMAASGCADDNTTPLTTDSAKTPVNIAVAVADAETSGQTRAVDKRFESNDVLVAHLQHVSMEGTNQTPQVSFAKTITLTMNADVVMTPVPESTNTQQTTSFTTNETLYWDDFSDATHDIRAEGHGLRSAWGYCYNGNSSALSSDNYSDIQVWSVATNQTSGIKSSDLLWSKTQEPVAYTHDKKNHGTITIPYTHAMSKATIELTASDGFGDTPFNNTSITLTNVNTKGKFTASTAIVQRTEAEDGYGTGNIQMHKISAGGKTASFDCLFVPNTPFTSGKKIAEVTDVEGNNYDIFITDAMVQQWGSPSAPGTNYKLVGTLKKQAIDIVAQITDWTEIVSTGNEGQIKFSTDFTFSTQPQDLGEGTSYDVFMTADTDRFEEKSTTRTLVAGIWTDDPVLYWKGEGQKRYFRGLAKLEKNGEGKELIKTVGGSLEANQGIDLLWATTTKHTGTKADGTAVTYEEGDAIDPRTSAVPLQFSHAMSKVKFVLTTSADDADDKVDLTGATVSIADVYTKGTVSMDKGIIGDRSSAETLEKPVTENSDGKYETEDCIVIPQSTSILTEPVRAKTLVITLNDNTTYSLKLPECKDDKGEKITFWEQGNYYVYTIKLTKAAIGFRAMIKDWNKKTGSGNASLDWD